MIWRFADLDDVGVRFLLGFASVDSCSLPSVGTAAPERISAGARVPHTRGRQVTESLLSLLQCCVGIRWLGIGVYAPLHIIS